MSAMPPKDKPISRRDFLGLAIKASLAGSALVGAGMLVRYLGFQSQPTPPGQLDLGPAAIYPPGSRTVSAEAQALVIHSDQGYRALSLVCPHLGCVVNVTSEGFTCPCHGSRYLPDGSLRNGPSSRPLAILKVEVDAQGHLILYTGS